MVVKTMNPEPSFGKPAVWPPCCCVAAFVEAALREFGHGVDDRRALAAELGIRVGERDGNPWDLPIEADSERRGLLKADAERRLPSVLRKYDADLRFRHVPFNMVTLRLYPELLAQALEQGCVVGVGVDMALLRCEQGSLRHVLRVQGPSSESRVTLLDDSRASPPARMESDWERVERAVRHIDDGFWIIGRRDRMQLDLGPSAVAST